ncbi:hypothetical protein AAF712_008922 [Marasmius tenuissimus]|uniref:F-box domain-containing protein n=1 Tax=Marasmius tenuissimus TaxID=585030 RepID=A0ABR2ZRA1_9AGAR
MSSTFPLPPELLAVVLDFVARGDGGFRQTIKKCALVARLWCSISRPYIFREIHISTTKEESRGWIARCKESPHLVPFITHITLTAARNSDSHSGDSDSDSERSDRGEEEAITRLALSSLAWDSKIADLTPHIAFLEQLASSAGGVQSVRLGNVEFVKPGDLLLYLSSIPGALVNLSLTSTGALDVETDTYRENGLVNHPQNLPHRTWPLSSLVLYHTELRRDILSWLLSTAVDLSSLHSLVVVRNYLYGYHGVSPSAKPLFEQLIVSAGSSLRHLTLGSYNNEVVEFPASHFHHLRELRQLILISQHESGLEPANGLSQLLALIPGLQAHSALEEIVLAVDLDLNSSQDVLDLRNLKEWGILDRELDTAAASIPTFRRLFVLVEISSVFLPENESEDFGENYCELVANAVREAMPLALAKGLLAIRGEDYWSGNRIKLLYHEWAFDHELII